MRNVQILNLGGTGDRVRKPNSMDVSLQEEHIMMMGCPSTHSPCVRCLFASLLLNGLTSGFEILYSSHPHERHEKERHHPPNPAAGFHAYTQRQKQTETSWLNRCVVSSCLAHCNHPPRQAVFGRTQTTQTTQEPQGRRPKADCRLRRTLLQRNFSHFSSKKRKKKKVSRLLHLPVSRRLRFRFSRLRGVGHRLLGLSD